MDHKFLHFRVHVGLRCGPCSDFLISRNYESYSNSPVQHLELVTTIDKHPTKRATLKISLRRTPHPCNSGILRIQEDPNIITIIPYSHYYWVGGPLNPTTSTFLELRFKP